MKGNSPHHLAHQRAYAERKAKGVKALPKPWDCMTKGRVQELALEAFQVATWQTRHEGSTPHEFIECLQSAFEVIAAAEAELHGIACAPAGASLFRQRALADVSPTWRPQYPLYAVIDREGGDQQESPVS